jgi:Lon protease-like protein
VPVFPLPETVFFPGTTLDLHVFEPRYRAWVEDASRGDGLISVALSDPPHFHVVGTVGSIQQLHRLPDGRYDLRLRGLERVEFTELPTDRPYRLVRAVGRPELPYDGADERIEQAKLELLASNAYVMREIHGLGTRSLVVDPSVSFEEAVNAVCAGLPFGASVRQRLLEEDDVTRRHRRASRRVELLLGGLLRRRNRRRAVRVQLDLN